MDAIRIIKASGVCPIKELLRLAKKAGDNDDDQLAFYCYKEIAQYAYPKLKAVEHSSSDDGPLTIQIVRFCADSDSS